MQFVIIAHDAKGMLEKRLEVRPRHLENLANTNGKVLAAGGMLDENGKPNGSAVIAEFESREALDEYLKTEPYIQAGVWEKVEVTPMNVAIFDGKQL